MKNGTPWRPVFFGALPARVPLSGGRGMIPVQLCKQGVLLFPQAIDPSLERLPEGGIVLVIPAEKLRGNRSGLAAHYHLANPAAEQVPEARGAIRIMDGAVHQR